MSIYLHITYHVNIYDKELFTNKTCESFLCCKNNTYNLTCECYLLHI